MEDHNHIHLDFLGFPIKIGDHLVRAITYCDSPGLEDRYVTKIDGKKIFLDDSKVPIRFPNRCINISYLRTMDSHLWETKV